MFACSWPCWSGSVRKGYCWVLCLGEWGFYPDGDPPKPEGSLFLLQQLKIQTNRTTCDLMYIEILKWASFSLKQEHSNSPLVVPVRWSSLYSHKDLRGLCSNHFLGLGLFLLQSFTSTLWLSLRPPTAFWKKSEEEKDSVYSERTIYIESSIKL